MRSKDKRRAPKPVPSRIEVLRTHVRQEFVNSSTVDITRQRDAWLYESTALDTELEGLQARVKEINTRRAELESCMLGLHDIVNTR